MKANSNLCVVCHSPILRLAILLILSGTHSAFGDGPGNSTSQYTGIFVDEQGRPAAREAITNATVQAPERALVEVTMVVTNTSEPVAQAAVSTYQVKAYTDSNGVAWLRSPTGQNWISAAVPDWSLQRRRVEIVAGQTNLVRIEMIPPPHISGTVRDPSGAPATGVQVSFYPGHYPEAPFYGETNTDKNGRYNLIVRQDSRGFGVWDGVINLTNFVLARDLKRNFATIQEFGSSPTNFGGFEVIPANLDLNLQPGISLSGSVVDSIGAPITNVAVDFGILAGGSFARVDDKPLNADVHGSFSISAMPWGRAYMISQVTANGYGSGYKWLDEKATQTNHLELPPLILKRADRILAGQVLGPDGQLVPGASVSFNGMGQRQWPTAKTDRSGHFLFDAVCEGEVHLSAYAYIGGPPGQGTFMTSGGGTGIKAQGGDTNIVIKLQKQNYNSSVANVTTPLHDTAKNGDINQVKSLLDNKADVNAKDLSSLTPLHEAARNGHAEVVELLLTNNADVRAKDSMGVTPLHEVAIGGNAEIATLLLAHGADVNARADNGFTPLHWAAMYDHGDVAAVLLAHGADVNAMSKNGETPLHWAVDNRWTDVAQLLRKHGGLEHGYEANHPDHTVTNWDAAELRDAIQSDDLKETKVLLKSNPSLISSKDNQGRTPLILAVMAGHTNVTEALLADKGDIQATDMFGRTALHWAVVTDHGDMVRLLLANGADINARTKEGYTPLHEAARSGRKDMAELLLANQADINATNNAGLTPLHLAVTQANRRVPPNFTGPAAVGFSKMLGGEKDVADFLRQHGGHE